MRKIINPFTHVKDYNCFGCSPENMNGLRMNFYEEDEFVYCDWQPVSYFQGYNNVLHGGIQATLMDEIASWTCNVKAGTAGVTYKIEAIYKKPVFTNKGTVHLKAKLVNISKNLASISVELYNAERELSSQATVVYFLLPFEKAKEELHYPGVQKFYKNS